MLQGEIWLEIVVIAQVEGLSIPHSPVFIISQSIFFHFILTQPGTALFMFFRRSEGRENEGMFLPDQFADIQHVGE